MTRPVLALLCALLALAGLDSAPVASARTVAPYTPRNGVTFNNILGTPAQELAIVTEIERAIVATPARGIIRIAHYSFDVDSTTEKLIAAHKRGVRVQMLIDRHDLTSQTKRLMAELGRDKTKPSFVAQCRRSCMSDNKSVMHAKFYLFSTAGSANLVSMVSSANLTHTNAQTSWNNNHTIVGDAKLYRSLYFYFYDMLKDQNDRNYFRTTTSGKYKLYLYPNAGRPGVNPVALLDVLSHVRCTGAAPGYGSRGRTVIRVAVYSWSYPRRDLAEKLWALHDRGCVVEVIENSARTNPRVVARLLKRSKRFGTMRVYDAWRDRNHNGLPERYMHHKLLTINGVWYRHPNTKVTYTGSQNFTANATVDNNDVILRILDNATLDAYAKNLSYIRDHGTKRVTRVPSSSTVAAAAAAQRRIPAGSTFAQQSE